MRETNTRSGLLRRAASGIRALAGPRRMASVPLPGTPAHARVAYSTAWSWAQLAGSTGDDSYVPIGSGEPIYRRAPRTVSGAVHWRFDNEFLRQSPPTFLAAIPNGRVWGAGGAVLAPDGKLIADLSRELTAPGTPHSFFNHPPSSPALIEDRVIVLAAAGGQSFYHWMFDVLPRLHLLRESGVHLDGSEHYVVNEGRHPFQSATLAALGIRPDQVIRAEPSLDLQARLLFAPSLPGNTGNCPRWACEFLRKSFPAGAEANRSPRSRAGRRVYVARPESASRPFQNESVIQKLVQARGFEVVEPSGLTFAEQVQLFREAEAVVAAHGGALANLVFCAPGTTVLELFSPSYVNVCYWALSEQVGLRYHYLLGESPDDRSSAAVNFDPDEVDRALDHAGL